MSRATHIIIIIIIIIIRVFFEENVYFLFRLRLTCRIHPRNFPNCHFYARSQNCEIHYYFRHICLSVSLSA